MVLPRGIEPLITPWEGVVLTAWPWEQIGIWIIAEDVLYCNMNFTPKKVCITTLGCDKNLADSEQLAGYLRVAGCTMVADDADADIIIVNTCGFINAARAESIDVITSKLRYLPRAQLVVCGCIVENNRAELAAGLPEVAVWWGTKDYQGLASLLCGVPVGDATKLLSTPPSYAYIKIAEGCNRRCAFCTIPLIRGNYVSRPVADIVAEVKHFAQLGVPEFILVAQDVTLYGVDLKTNLVQLLRAITAVDGVKRVRLHYCYPELLTDELLNEMANNDKIVKYLDIPFQHCNPRILRLMHRQGDAASDTLLIKKIRTLMPTVTLRATMMVGFPTETDAEFAELVDFLKAVKLDYVGFFAYSREQGTAAYALPQVPAKVKQQRLRMVEKVQQQILAARQQAQIGKRVAVVCDAVENGVARCRTFGQSPDVDPCVLVTGDLVVGQEYVIVLLGAGNGKLIWKFTPNQ